MRLNENIKEYSYPIAIGAIGGSGTRVVAGILQEMNVYIGHHLSRELDNLIFTYFFKFNEIRYKSQQEIFTLIELFCLSNIGPKTKLNEEENGIFLRIYEEKYHKMPDLLSIESLFRQIKEYYTIDKPIPERWGWKEPNTHIILPELIEYFPEIKYVHVVRHGLDMAYSNNQNQSRLWGETFLGRPFEPSPSYSLSYWCAVHQRIKSLQQKFPDNILTVSFDKLCTDPVIEISNLLDFCQIDYNKSVLINLAQNVISPVSRGRFREFGISHFNPEDIQFVQEMGFSMD